MLFVLLWSCRFSHNGGRSKQARYRYKVGITPVDDVVNDVTKQYDDVVNDIVKFTDKEELAVKALVRDPRLSAARLADLIGVKQRQAQRIIASLKNTAGLKRRGAAKNGEWYFERGK